MSILQIGVFSLVGRLVEAMSTSLILEGEKKSQTYASTYLPWGWDLSA